jgi:glucosylceramidase
MKYRYLIPLLGLLVLSCTKPESNQTQNIEAQTYISEGKSAEVYTTAKDTHLKMEKTGQFNFEKAKQPLETEIFVVVNPLKSFQSFIGIGGAITDASAEVFAKLSEERQDELINAYYSDYGLKYNLMRTSIHSCDFSSASYTYIEEGDKELKSFNIAHDKKFRVPMIKRAIEKANGEVILFASPWSPPAFMKDNNNMLKGGKLLAEYYDSWANYFVKFINAYKQEGINIWGITIQNEPMAVQTWESCIFTAEEERDFLKNHLGPVMEKNGLGDIKIIVWDHNRDLMSHRANTIFEDPEASKYAWGMGFHWYETWTGASPKFENVQNVKESYPDKNLLFTEGCNGPFDPAKYEFWQYAERYGQSMINDFNYGAVGWTDWNILLDETGGPNHVGNFCFAPIHADIRTDSLIYTPAYYYIGHFAKFIRPGAVRISTTTSRNSLLSTSFLNKNGKLVTVIMNQTDNKINYKLIVGENSITIEIPAHAIQTIIS